jgi:hypothetical protein
VEHPERLNRCFFSRGWNSVWNRYGIDVFSISVPHENPLFSGLFQLFSGNGTDGTDVNILSSYKEKNI